MARTPSRPLLPAYQSGALQAFHRVAPGDLTAPFVTPHPADRDRLADALTESLRRVDAAPEALANVERLRHPASRVVVTGQQAGLLLGPAYTVSKAVNTVLLAAQLDREDAPVVPVFWVASQDHDANEAAGTFLLDASEVQHRLSVPLPAGVPVGRVALHPAWVERVVLGLRAFAGPKEHREWVTGLVLDAAAGAATHADWFTRLLNALLGPWGLVPFNPLDEPLAELFRPGLERELDNPLAGPHAIEDSALELEAQGFAAQLRRPSGATNLFLEGRDGQRRLLRFDGRNFQADRPYPRAELDAIVRLEPGRLTPAAGLRPVFADMVLPSAVSVLGPGELAYHMELSGVYRLHRVAQPLLWPRLTVTWLEAPVRRALKHYGLSADAFMRDPAASLEGAALNVSGAGEAFRAGLVDLELAFENLAHRLDDLDPTLQGALVRSRSRVMGHVSRLERKVAAAVVRDEVNLERADERLRRFLVPDGVPQERHYSFLTYLLKHGRYPLDRLRELEPTGDHYLDL
ncbi:MAG TPA: bacillithiol biosynthesis cysteine-adding enzyme BshC [Deinococcales bacterium]|nr:bacillithiol biosynthesis cysteine-adding enzyme BshC [Deinococcales bacterium]